MRNFLAIDISTVQRCYYFYNIATLELNIPTQLRKNAYLNCFTKKY